MAPSFPQPMYEALKEKSQELLLPGLDKVLPDTVLGLRTNRAFVEAYMIGLNVEMARELLWRGFPTDQRGTYFRNFWGTDGAPSAVSDIGDLRQNLGRALGTAPPNSPAEPVRAPAAQQPAAPLPERHHLSDAGGDRHGHAAAGHLSRSSTARWSPTSTSPAFRFRQAGDRRPRQSGLLRGHPGASHRAALRSRGAGQPRPCSRRRHISRSAPSRPSGVPLKGRTWGRNSGHMADITRRLPVRITIHASQLVSLP